MTKRHLRERLLLVGTLLISILLGSIPLAGIGWIIVTRTITTVDGLFMSLILLTLSGIFFLNAFLELRDRGLLAFLQKKKRGLRRNRRRPKRVEGPRKTWRATPFPRTLGIIHKKFRTLHLHRQRLPATCPPGIASFSFWSLGLSC